MSAERQRQVEELYKAALEKEQGDRAAFVAQAAEGDADLRTEVESLLAQGAATATDLSPGAQIGPYRIEALLGAGGMGRVYKARDTRLDRTVAIKVCREEFSERFQREARAIAALNHPHICTLHDVGPDYLVMEYVEGKALKGPLPLDKVLEYGAQICEALEAAHRKGIVHRDLKPSNVLVTRSGVKVLDFGLAKMPGDETLTQAGAVMGTPAYMAPEQWEGKEADARSDIYTLGRVVYEMASGEREPHKTLEPAPLDRVVKTCLAADPEERWQSAREVNLALELARPAVPASAEKPHLRWGWRRGAVIAATALLLLVAAGYALSVWALRPPLRDVSPTMTRFTIDLPSTDQFPIDAGLPVVVAVTPDGRHFLYVARRGGRHQIYSRRRDELQATPVVGTEGAIMPFLSPDGQWIGFVSKGELRKVPLSGGPAVTLCEAPNPVGASWGPNDSIVFGPTWESGLMAVSAQGGRPTPLTTLKTPHETAHRDPHMLPEGSGVLFTVFARGLPSRIEVLVPLTGDRKVLAEGTNPVYVPSGHLVFARAGTLLAAGFDLRRLELTTTPLPVLEGVRSDGKAHFAIAHDGTLAYVPAVMQLNTLTWVDRNGRARAISTERRAFSHPRLSPDGNRIAASIAGDVWVYAAASGTRTQLTNALRASRPIWTPDGKQITFAGRTGDRRPALYTVLADGSSEPKLLLAPPEPYTAFFPLAWSRDGQHLAFSAPHPARSRDIFVLPSGGEAAPVVSTLLDERAAMFSPDGRWLVYAVKEAGRDEEVYVQAYPGPGTRWLISSGGGTEPVWSPTGQEIFYRTPDGTRMMSVTVQTRPTLQAAAPRQLFQGGYAVAPGNFWANYDVGPDGQQFLMLEPEQVGSDTQVAVILNWFEELKRRVPVR